LFSAAEIVDTEAPAAFATSRIVTWRLTPFAFDLNLLPRFAAYGKLIPLGIVAKSKIIALLFHGSS
jgi:hypothetical protein